MAGNIACDRQKGKPKKGQKMAQPPKNQRRRERASPSSLLSKEKSNKNRWLEPPRGRQKGKPKKGQKMAHSPGTKEGRELVPLLYKANWETFGKFLFPSVNNNNHNNNNNNIFWENLAILFTSLKKFTLKKESPIGNAVRSP
jgi:hypothetical protein